MLTILFFYHLIKSKIHQKGTQPEKIRGGGGGFNNNDYFFLQDHDIL